MLRCTVMENLELNIDDDNILSLENKKRIEYFEIAASEAFQSEMDFKHGAVLVKNNEIIAKGCNYNFGEKICHGVYSVHAEVNVLQEAKRMKIDMKNVDLYVVRVSNLTGEFMISYPCKNCQKMIEKCNVRRTYYSIGDLDEYNERRKIQEMHEEKKKRRSKMPYHKRRKESYYKRMSFC